MATSKAVLGAALTLLLLVTVGLGAARAEEQVQGWMGVAVRPLEDGEAAELGFDGEHGLLVQRVMPGSPAEDAGLRSGDILTHLGPLPTRDLDHLREVLVDTRPGTTLRFAFWRDGKMFERDLVLGSPPSEPEGTARGEPAGPEGRFRATQAERRELDVRRERVHRALRETRQALLAASEAGRTARVRELAEKLVDLGHEAGRLEVRAEVLAHQAEEREEHLRRGRAGESEERAAAERQIEIMRLAMKALAEMEHREAEALVERRIHAMEVALAGRHDAEAREIREAAPGDGAMAELLLHAAAFYREHDAPDRADMCERLGRHFQERWRRQQETRAPRREEAGEEAMRRLEIQLHEMREQLEILQRELDRLRR